MARVKAYTAGTRKAMKIVARIVNNQKRFGIWDAVGLFMKQVYGETFRSQGAKSGKSKWKPLNSAYAKWKVAHGKTSKPLIFSGLLQGSGRTLSSNERHLNWGTDVPYAKYHQDGTKNMPQRKIIFLTQRNISKVNAIVSTLSQQWADRLINRLGWL